MRSDGEIRWIHDISRCEAHETLSGYYRLYGAAQDITGRKQSEEKLRQAARVFENTVEGVMITDASEQILAVSYTHLDVYKRQALPPVYGVWVKWASAAKSPARSSGKSV